MSSRFSVEAVFSAIDRMTAPIRKMQFSSQAFTKGIQNDFIAAQRRVDKLGPTLMRGAAIGALALGAGFAFAIKKASEMENATSSYTTLLGGNKDAAEKLVGQLQLLGAETPFEFKDLSDATGRLLGFGVATKDNVIPTLRMIGDLAQGSAEKMQGISLVYGQIMAGGKMMGQDFNQLINQQVPIAQGLAKVWGVTVTQAIKRVKTAGPVAAEDVQKAMIQMTSEGGLFFNGMMRASKTFTGLWSTFMDSIGMTAAGIGNELLPEVKNLLIGATTMVSRILKWVQQNKELIKTFINIIKAIAPFLPIILSVIGAYYSYIGVLTLAAAAQNIFNKAVGLSPMAKLFLILGLIVGVIIYLRNNWDQYTDTTKKWIGIAVGIIGVIASIIALVRAWSAAQIILNFLLTANPIGIIVVAVAALVGWLIYLNHNMDSMLQKFYDLTAMFDKPIWKALLAGLFGANVAGLVGATREGIASKKPDVTTQREALANTINSNSNQRVIIENQSGSGVRSGTRSINQGTSLALSPSG